MAESADKAAKSAEQAYAAAAAAAPPAKPGSAKAEAAPITTDQPVTDEASAAAAPVPRAAAAKPVPAPKSAAPKRVPRKTKPVEKKPAAKVSRKVSKPRRAAAPKAAAVPANVPVPTITELKEKIMATAKTTTDFSKPFTDAFGDIQSKAKAAYEKSTALAAEATEFAKGNVEAVVESSKVYAAGVQTLGKSYVEEAKSAYETLTGDLKEFAAVKSPAELFQLQGKLARRNFDTLVAYSSKNTDAVLKLMNETMAPISGRISLAAEKISKAA